MERLRLKVLINAVPRLFLAEPRLLDATERRYLHGERPGVQPHQAELQHRRCAPKRAGHCLTRMLPMRIHRDCRGAIVLTNRKGGGWSVRLELTTRPELDGVGSQGDPERGGPGPGVFGARD
jgi:hypothetical protein